MKKNYITALSIISAFAVVFIHNSGTFWAFSTQKYWPITNVVNSVCCFCVPCFFMITGANLLDYMEKYSTKEYFKKRIKKTLILWFFWTIVAILFRCFYEHSLNIHDIGIRVFINGLINSNFLNIYWFFVTLFMIYLTIPLFAAIRKEKKIPIFTYLVILGFFINILIPFVNTVFKLNIDFNISIDVTRGYFFYVLLGYLLDRVEIKKYIRIIIYLLSMIGLSVMILATYHESMKAGTVIWTYRGYMNVTCVFYSIGVFVFFKYLFLKLKSIKLEKVLNFLGKHTFAMYLMHWYIMKVLRYVFHLDQYATYWLLGMPFVIILICIIFSTIIKKIPILKHILP